MRQTSSRRPSALGLDFRGVDFDSHCPADGEYDCEDVDAYDDDPAACTRVGVHGGGCVKGADDEHTGR